MKKYIRATRMTYHEFMDMIRPIYNEIAQALRQYTDFNCWQGIHRYNRDGTARVQLGFGIFDGTEPPTAKDARRAVLEAIQHCSPELQDRIVKVTCGYQMDRGGTNPVVGITVTL